MAFHKREVLTHKHSVVCRYTKSGSNSYLNELSKKAMKTFNCRVLWNVKVNPSQLKPSPEYEVIELSSAPLTRGDNRYYLQHAQGGSNPRDQNFEALTDHSITSIADKMHSDRIEDLIKHLELKKKEQLICELKCS